jgi:2',3'-cyclic-nucleotide 2'-phosphodiesterase/3'-nucleotidase
VSLIRLFLVLSCAAAALAQQVKITVLATTDLHGNLYPYDYFTAKPAERGLAKIAALIREERERNPNHLLIDCGDTIQGSPLESVYQNYVRTGKLPEGLAFTGQPLRTDPMMAAMNLIGYDAMVVGNHEYNFGLKNLERARGEAHFPWLSANTSGTAGSMKPFAPYVVKTVAGVKIGIIGITTPAVPSWEKPENYRGLAFLNAVESAQRAVADLRARRHPDLVLIAAHAGLDRDLRSGRIRPGETGVENPVYQLATHVRGVDAIVFGHSHQQLEDSRIGDVLLVQPKNWGISLARLDFELERHGEGWRVISKSGKLIPVTKETATDQRILALAKPYHDLTERYLDLPVAESPAEMDGILSRVEDTPLVDAIEQVQLFYTKADVSLTAMFNPRVRFRQGPVTVRQVAALYIYDNELYTIEGTGKMLREALENAARYFLGCPQGACPAGTLINRGVMGFNFDMAQGVQYEIDLTQPEGSRIRNLRFRGKPLDDAQPLRIALNNYRAGGSAGYTMFRNARVIWKSGEEIRDLIISYYTDHKILPAKADGNWRIVPESARNRLLEEARAEAARTANY